MLATYSNSQSMVIVCRYTGIQAKIELPRVGNLTLEYTHPLSHIDSALEASSRQDFMRRLDAPVLAGILLTLLRHTKLLASAKDHAASVNANLSKAKKGHLIKAIELVRRHVIPLDKTHFLPKVTFDYYETQGEATRALESTVGTLIAQALNNSSLLEQVKNYFRAHTKATTFDGYSREVAMVRAVEADNAKAKVIHAEAERRAAVALRRLDAARKAKEGMLTKKAMAAETKTVRTMMSKSELSLKQRQVLTHAVAAASVLTEDKLDTLLTRLESIRAEATKDATHEVVNACVAIFTHYKKEQEQRPFSLEDELLGLDTVHGEAKEEEVAVEEEEAQPEPKPEPVAPKSTTRTHSLLAKLRAKSGA